MDSFSKSGRQVLPSEEHLLSRHTDNTLNS